MSNQPTNKCAYCGQIIAESHLKIMDEKCSKIDEEDLEAIYDQLGPVKFELGSVEGEFVFSHKSKLGYLVHNICEKCFQHAEN